MPSASTVSIGSMARVAHSRGTTSLRTGSAAIERIASTCSVTAIDPISAVIPDPTLPPTISAVSTGPSSRTRDRATSSPI